MQTETPSDAGTPSTDMLYNDLEIFMDHAGGTDHAIFTKLDRTLSASGREQLRGLLSSYTTNITELKDRQYQVLKIKSDFAAIQSDLRTFAANESTIIDLWNPVSDEMQAFYDIVYFNFPFEFANRICNRNETLLQCSNLYNIWLAPLFNVAIPLLTVIVPYLVYFIAKYILRYEIPAIPITTFIKFMFSYILSSYLGKGILGQTNTMFAIGILVWAAFYCINSYQSIKSSYDTHVNINKLHRKVNAIKTVVAIADKLHRRFGAGHDEMIAERIASLKELLKDDIFDVDPYLLSNKGKILLTYHLLTDDEFKAALQAILQYIGRIDAFHSIARLMDEDGYTFANYLTKKSRPAFYALGIWHPAIPADRVVYNNVMMRDRRGGKQLITGPNKAGKSTYIKSVAIAVLLAQTIGVVNAKKLYLTPYSAIRTHLHIPDKTGYESLFEAELKRANGELATLETGKFVFIIMDEILTSTNYIEGYSAAYAIAKKMSKYDNANIMITTHYGGLTKLEEETAGVMRNYYFDLKKDEETGEIKYNYRLKQGVSKQFIALELLTREFSSEISDEANAIAKKLHDSFNDSFNDSFKNIN